MLAITALPRMVGVRERKEVSQVALHVLSAFTARANLTVTTKASLIVAANAG